MVSGAGPHKKKQKMSLSDAKVLRGQPVVITIAIPDTPDHPGCDVSVLKAAHPMDDLEVEMTKEAFAAVIQYIRTIGIYPDTEVPQRTYRHVEDGAEKVYSMGNGRKAAITYEGEKKVVRYVSGTCSDDFPEGRPDDVPGGDMQGDGSADETARCDNEVDA